MMLVFNWANDPLTRQMSFNQEAIPFETHKKWFKDILAKKWLFIIELDDRSVAQFRIDNAGEISIAVASEYRGQHLAEPTIKMAVAQAKKVGRDTIFAHIKPENTVSIRAFEKAGFIYIKDTTIKGNTCKEYVYRLK